MNPSAEQFPILQILNQNDLNEQKIYEDLKKGKLVNGINDQIKQYSKWAILSGHSSVGFIGVVKIIESGKSPTEYKFRPFKTVDVVLHDGILRPAFNGRTHGF